MTLTMVTKRENKADFRESELAAEQFVEAMLEHKLSFLTGRLGKAAK